ncbi:MAG: polysaccharide pyruvyl transferase family protein [Muribaculaceae bacterium]|nr:polysaccharide pyruvyl transferase family protein [Muribaculaceae bacterium]
MKIVVVTVYNSHNSGSFLQAYCTMRVLQSMGHDVAFLLRPIEGSSHDRKEVAKTFFRNLTRLKFRRAFNSWRMWRVYEALQRPLQIVSVDSDFYKEADCVVIGSDTLWNFSSNYFSRYASMYLGDEFVGKRVITYATSAANTPSERFASVVERFGGLDNVATILVRDSHTRQLVADATGRDANVVADPTLIASQEMLDKFKSVIKCRRPYLLLYFFGKMPQNLQEKIQRYAADNCLEIVSMPSVRQWCNYSIMSSPQNMISYFASAAAVVTNTFHGTAFSLIYGKPFAVYDEGKNKVADLLATYGESDRLFAATSNIDDILSRENAVVSSGRFDAVRNQSLNSLIAALKNETD